MNRITVVIWKLLMAAETRFRHLNAPELLERIYLGASMTTESDLLGGGSTPDAIYAPVGTHIGKI